VKLYSIEIDTSSQEFQRLNDKQWLNDNIINMCTQCAFHGVASAEVKSQTILMNTFFYPIARNMAETDTKIIRCLKRQKVGPDTCYIMIPINQDDHWTLAIIANLNGDLCKLGDEIEIQVRENHKDFTSPATPFILYIDSLYSISNEKRLVLNRVATLAHKLINGSSDKDSREPDSPPNQIFYHYYSYRLRIPKQTNSFDCGIFLIEYVVRFLHKPLKLFDKYEDRIIHYHDLH
jgi:sentrin-specific protease 7